jgi:SAM-dependent methyltransferase
VVDLNQDGLPFPDQYFEAVTILSTLQYFQDLYLVLGECQRVLSPSGILLLSVPNMRAFWRLGRLLLQGSFPRVSLDQEGYDGGTLHYFAFANLKQLLHETGFEVVWAHGIFCLPSFLEGFPDSSLLGKIKREFFSAEIFIMARKG